MQRYQIKTELLSIPAVLPNNSKKLLLIHAVLPKQNNDPFHLCSFTTSHKNPTSDPCNVTKIKEYPFPYRQYYQIPQNSLPLARAVLPNKKQCSLPSTQHYHIKKLPTSNPCSVTKQKKCPFPSMQHYHITKTPYFYSVQCYHIKTTLLSIPAVLPTSNTSLQVMPSPVVLALTAPSPAASHPPETSGIISLETMSRDIHLVWRKILKVREMRFSASIR